MWLNRKMDDNGQMMVLETVFFVATVVLSIVFLYQLTPSSVVSDVYTSDLKALGDDALLSVYNDVAPDSHPSGYPTSKLVHYHRTEQK